MGSDQRLNCSFGLRPLHMHYLSWKGLFLWSCFEAVPVTQWYSIIIKSKRPRDEQLKPTDLSPLHQRNKQLNGPNNYVWQTPQCVHIHDIDLLIKLSEHFVLFSSTQHFCRRMWWTLIYDLNLMLKPYPAKVKSAHGTSFVCKQVDYLEELTSWILIFFLIVGVQLHDVDQVYFAFFVLRFSFFVLRFFRPGLMTAVFDVSHFSWLGPMTAVTSEYDVTMAYYAYI